jgi:hypothetical protein
MIIGSSFPSIALNTSNSYNDNRSSSIPSVSNQYSPTSATPYSIRTLNSIPGSKSTNDNLRITNTSNNKLVILSF